MAKHDNIIKNLTAEQKGGLALNALTLSDDKYAEGDIPRVRFDGCEDDRYPSYKAMANCWNKSLMQRAWQDMASAKSQTAEVLFSPAMGVCNSPYSSGAVEDPYLAGLYVGALTEGVKNAGLTAAVTCNFDGYDVAFMDAQPDERAFCEYYMRPFKYASYGSAICFPYKNYGGAYGDIYTKLTNSFVHKFCDGTAALCTDVPKKLLADCLNGGNIALDGDVTAAGEIFPVKTEQTEGEEDPALTFLDGAADLTVDFALKVKMQKDGGESAEFDESLPLAVAEESCVLLKNDGVLPLRRGSAVAVLGNLSDDVNAQKLNDYFVENSFTSFWKDGYSFKEDISPQLATEGVRICAKASYCVVFLGFDKKTGEDGKRLRRTKLPASQLALLDRIASQKKKIIAVVGSEYPADLSFADGAAAVLLCPSSGKYTAQAVFNILSGKTSPSGKLARAWYADTDRRFSLLQNDYRSGIRKAGVFAGYRGGAEDEKTVYPFGFGLSYSKFEYSNLTVEGNVVKFDVKNAGMDAGEVIQIYIGKPDSAVVRPEYELKAVLKINLKAGECKSFSTKILPETLGVYSEGGFLTEDGEYTVYVGRSCRDIRLKGSIWISGAEVKPDGKKLSSYKVSESNVLEGGYTLSPVKAGGKGGGKPLVAGLLTSVAALFLTALFAILYLDNYIDYAEADVWSIVAAVALAAVVLTALVLILTGVRLNMKSGNGTNSAVKRAGGKTERVKQNPYEQLFSDLYGFDEDDYLPEENEEEEVVLAEEPEEEEASTEAEISIEGFVGKYDSKITFADACRGLSAYCDYTGLSAGVSGARKIMAAMAASRIIVLEGNSPLNGALTEALCGYFGCGVYRGNMAEINDTAALIADGSPFAEAVKAARENPDGVYIAVLENAGNEKVLSCFAPFIRCAYENGRRYVMAGGEKTELPPNVWFIVVPDPEAGVDYADAAFCNCAAVLVPDLSARDRAPEPEYEKITYSQFMGMLDRITNYDESGRYVLDEDHCWKKIDKLEKYLNGKCGYSLNNRDCLSIERCAAVYLACGSEQNDALDGVAACKLILPFMALLKDAELEEGEINSKIESIFDECGDIKKVINSYGLVK